MTTTARMTTAQQAALDAACFLAARKADAEAKADAWRNPDIHARMITAIAGIWITVDSPTQVTARCQRTPDGMIWHYHAYETLSAVCAPDGARLDQVDAWTYTLIWP